MMLLEEILREGVEGVEGVEGSRREEEKEGEGSTKNAKSGSGNKTFVVLEDSLQTKCFRFHLLRSLLSTSSSSSSSSELSLVALDFHPLHYSELLAGRKVVVIDGYTNPLGWERRDSTSEKQLETLLNLQDILLALKESKQTLVVLDSLSTLLQHFSSQQICSFLHAIWTHSPEAKIVGTVNRDLHSTHDLATLEFIANFILRMEPTALPHVVSCSSIIKKRVGRVTRKVEKYQCSGHTIRLVEEEAMTTKITEKKEDPTESLTFNLRLTEDEKNAKESVILPYRHHLNKQQEESQIQDDIEDDLDDDLDI